MRLTLLIPFLLLFLFNVNAQSDSLGSSKQDSLLDIIIYENNYQRKLELYYELVLLAQNNDINKSIAYCDIALGIAEKKGLHKFAIDFNLAKSRSLIMKGNLEEASVILLQIENQLLAFDDDRLWGQFYLVKNLAFGTVNDYANAMDNGLKAVTFLEKANDSLSLAKAYNNIGVIYELTENRQKALEYYLLAEDYALKLNNQDMIGDLYNNIGVIYDMLDDNEQALKYYYKSLETSNKLDKQRGMALSFSNIAMVHLEMKRFEEAKNNFLKSYTIYQKFNNKPGLANVFDNLGNYFVAIANYDSAVYYFKKCIDLNLELNDLYSANGCKKELGDLFLSQKKYKQALELYQSVYNFANHEGYYDLKQKAALAISKTYGLFSNYKQAFYFQSVAMQIADSINDIKKAEDVKHSELQIEFKNQTRKYESELERFQLNRERANRTKTRERVFFIMVFVLAFFVGFILFRNYKSTIRLNNKLLKQNREIEDQKELIEISNIELREQYTFTETLLNTIPNPVYYTDKNSILLGCNKAFEEISGRSSEDLVGFNIAELNVRSLLTCDTAKLFGNPGKNLIRSQGTIVYKDKKEHDVNVYRKGIVNSDAKLIGTLGIIIDVTDFKKAERDLQYSQLKLKDAISAKDKFFNIMAHDLKNPFNAILGLTSLIADQFDDHSKEDLKQFVKLINQSANNVYNLLENLLEWARTQSGSIDFLPITFPIVDVIQESLNLFNHSLEQKKLAVNFDSKEYLVYADQNMIKTVFRNLLSNAIKYSYDKGVIDIILEPSGELLLVHIQDHGVGIKTENLEHIFRIEQPITTPGVNNERGTGLGLIICQEFVRQNSGTLSVSSESGNGSRFTFSLPLVM